MGRKEALAIGAMGVWSSLWVAAATLESAAVAVATMFVSAQMMYQLIASLTFARIDRVIPSFTSTAAGIMAVAAMLVVPSTMAILVGVSAVGMMVLRFAVYPRMRGSVAVAHVQAVSWVAAFVCGLSGLFIFFVVDDPGIALALACAQSWAIFGVLASSVLESVREVGG